MSFNTSTVHIICLTPLVAAETAPAETIPISVRKVVRLVGVPYDELARSS
jgi:hypothetical protein